MQKHDKIDVAAAYISKKYEYTELSAIEQQIGFPANNNTFEYISFWSIQKKRTRVRVAGIIFGSTSFVFSAEQWIAFMSSSMTNSFFRELQDADSPKLLG